MTRPEMIVGVKSLPQGFEFHFAALSRPEMVQGLKRSHQSLTRFLKELKSIGIEAA